MYSIILFACLVLINFGYGEAELKHVFVTFRAQSHTPCDYPTGPNITGTPEENSELTPKGRLDAFKLGKWMYYKYSSKMNILSKKDLLFWSIGPKRVQEAILVAKAGWNRDRANQNKKFLEEELRAVKFPYRHEFTKFYNKTQCPAFFTELGKQKKDFQKLLKKYDNTIKTVNKNLKGKINIKNPEQLWLAYETLQMQEAAGKKPEWVTDQIKKDMKDFSAQYLYTATSTQKLRHLAAGSITYDVMHDIEEMTLGKKRPKSDANTDPKISFLAVPQIVMAGFVVAFLPEEASYGTTFTAEDMYPENGAVHIVELHVYGKDTWKMKVIYKNKEKANWRVLKLPKCSETCPVNKALEILKDLQLNRENLVKECTAGK